MKQTINNNFIKKYSKLISDDTCRFANIDPKDDLNRAVYAYNQLNPTDPISAIKVAIGDKRSFYVCEDGQVYDEERNTYIMDVISALLHPEEFREILFNRPTNQFRGRPQHVYVGTLSYEEYFCTLRHLYEEMIYAANTLSDSITLRRWRPLILAFTTHSYIGLNLTTTDVYGNTYALIPDEEQEGDYPELITDGTVLFSSGKVKITDMSKIDGKMRYWSPHYYQKKEDKE